MFHISFYDVRERITKQLIVLIRRMICPFVVCNQAFASIKIMFFIEKSLIKNIPQPNTKSFKCVAQTLHNGVTRTLKKIHISKGDYWIEQ